MILGAWPETEGFSRSLELVLDDFRLYDYPLSPAEIQALAR